MTIELAKALLQEGAHFKIPGNRARAGISGRVLGVKRATFTYSCWYMDSKEMVLTHRLDDCEGLQAAMPWPREEQR